MSRNVPEMALDPAASRAMPRIALLSVVLLLSILAGVGVANPDLWGPAVLVVAIAAAAVILMVRPRMALMIAFFLVLAAITKFRVREGTALLEGNIDAQVVFELAAYAAILAIVLVNLLSSSWGRGHRLVLSRAEKLLGAYLVLAMMSVVWSVDVRVTVVRVVQLLTLYCLALITVRELGPIQALRALTVAVVGYVFLGSSLALIFPWAKYTYVPGLFSWFTLHPGVAGTCAATGALLLLSQALLGGGLPLIRVLRWLSITALVVIVVATHQRTPVLAFTAGALALWTRRVMRPWLAGAMLFTLCATVVVGLHALGASTVDAVPSGQSNPIIVYLLRGQTGEQFLSLTGRVDLWGYIQTLVRERPVLGYGYVASRSILLERFPWAGSAHSAALEVLLNLGLVGTVLIGWAAVRTLGSAFLRPLSWGRWAEGGVLAVMVYLFVDAVAGESFAGAPGYEVFLFFVVAMAYDYMGGVGEADDA